MPELSSLPLGANLLLFFMVGGLVWMAGTRLTVYADSISERTGTSKALMGFLFLALATQLPEVVTNTTGALAGEGALVVNSMFGGIAMQTAVLAVADLIAFKTVLTYRAYRSANQLQGVLLMLALATLLSVTIMGEYRLIWHLGAGTLGMAVMYVAATILLWRYEQDRKWKVAEQPDETRPASTETLTDVSLGRLKLYSLFAAAVILVSGIALVFLAETVASQSGLGTSFIGVTLLATATSLPELSTIIAAIRRGAHSMAVSDIFGSNLIMLFLLLPTDLFYTEGVLLGAVDASAQFALLLGLVLTGIYLVGLLMRSARRLLGMGMDSWAVLVCYALGIGMLYTLR